MESIILIDVPSKIYPELRRIFVFIRKFRFQRYQNKKKLIFEKLYKMKKVQ